MKHIRILILCIAFALLTGCAPVAQDTAAYARMNRSVSFCTPRTKKRSGGRSSRNLNRAPESGSRSYRAAQTNCLSSCKRSRTHHRGRRECSGGGVESLEACRALFEPYVCRGAEQILPQYRAQDSSWTPFSSLPVVLVYNPKLLSSGQLSCWADLLDPALRGQVAFADPSVSGSSYTALVTMLCALGGDADEVLQTFAENLDGKLLSGSGGDHFRRCKRRSARRHHAGGDRAQAHCCWGRDRHGLPHRRAQAAYRTAAPR